MDDTVTCLPALQNSMTGFKSYTESSIFAPPTTTIDVDIFTNVDWGFTTIVPMEVSPPHKIKQERVLEVRGAEEVIKILDVGLKKKGKT